MGLIANIFRSEFGSCSNNGISETYQKVCIVNASGPFEPTSDAPAVIAVNHVYNCVSLVPAERSPTEPTEWIKVQGKHFMMGGCYVASSDSRFRDCIHRVGGLPFYGAVALHDRTEDERL